MGLFSGIAKIALPAIGTAFGGPIGGAIGGAAGKLIGGSTDYESMGADIGNAWQSANSAKKAEESYDQTNAQNQANFERQLGFNAEEAAKARDFNANEAAKSRDYQTHMSNTQYQRAVGDMEAAGLNPMLAYQQGGAGNVSGATASGSAASAAGAPSLAASAASGINTALRATEVSQALRSSEANIQLAKANVAKTVADTDTSVASAANTRQLTRNLVTENGRILQDIDLKKEQSRTEVSKQALNAAQEYLVNAQESYTRGTITYQEFIRRQEAAKAVIMEKDINRADAMSKMWGSNYGQNIAPYVSSVSEGVNSASKVLGLFK